MAGPSKGEAVSHDFRQTVAPFFNCASIELERAFQRMADRAVAKAKAKPKDDGPPPSAKMVYSMLFRVEMLDHLRVWICVKDLARMLAIPEELTRGRLNILAREGQIKWRIGPQLPRRGRPLKEWRRL